MDEFDLIRRYLAPLAGPEGLGLLDDAALYTPPPGFDLVLTKDTMVEGVHFPKGEYGAVTAGKLLRVNLSDLAAKAADAIGYLLSIAIPAQMTESHVEDFALGLSETQSLYDLQLFGGDTVSTAGPLVVSATLIGSVPSGKMIMRSGARPGDDIWITGQIGAAYLGLQRRLGKRPIGNPAWVAAYDRPHPRLALRNVLRQHANASADVSDGLIADCDNIASASDVSFVLHAQDIPAVVTDDVNFKTLATAGDDYEIVFTASEKSRGSIESMSKDLDFSLSRIGRVMEGEGVVCLDASGQPMTFDKVGYSHFIQ